MRCIQHTCSLPCIQHTCSLPHCSPCDGSSTHAPCAAHGLGVNMYARWLSQTAAWGPSAAADSVWQARRQAGQAKLGSRCPRPRGSPPKATAWCSAPRRGQCASFGERVRASSKTSATSDEMQAGRPWTSQFESFGDFVPQRSPADAGKDTPPRPWSFHHF